MKEGSRNDLSLTLRFGIFVGVYVVHMYCISTAGHLCPGYESSNVETVKPCLLCASVRVETPICSQLFNQVTLRCGQRPC